jgi:hypothetical protein
MKTILLDDFHKLSKLGFEYKLPDNVICILGKLTKELGILVDSFQGHHEISSSTSSIKKHRPIKKWDRMKTIKPTPKIIYEGIEKDISDIRIFLNKISDKNYETIKNSIEELISRVLELQEELSDIEDGEENCRTANITKISTMLFNISSTNIFYSALYAKLYKDLIYKFAILETDKTNIIVQYLQTIDTISYIDPNNNYELFCDNNKMNDRRKAMTTFIVNLMRNEILSKCEVLDTILFLLSKIELFTQDANRKNELEEITENIYIYISLLLSGDKDRVDFFNFNKGSGEPIFIHITEEDEKWSSIVDKIVSYSKLGIKENPGFSSRSKFKYMDILDILKKKKIIV